MRLEIFAILRLSNPTTNLWYHTIQHQNWCFAELVLSCQNAAWGWSTPIAYIVKFMKNQKRQTLEMNLPFLKNDITKNFGALIFTFSLQISVIPNTELKGHYRQNY